MTTSPDVDRPDLTPHNLFSAFEDVDVEIEDYTKEGFIFKHLPSFNNDATESLSNTVEEAIFKAIDQDY